MKKKMITNKTTFAASILAIAFAGAGTLIAEEKGHEGHDHAEHAEEGHEEVKAGPNGGKVIHEVDPHLEFFVTKDRKVQITALDKDGKAVPIAEQSVKVTGGDRANPTRMTFAKEGDVLVSDIAFPEGNDFPVVVQIKATPDAKTVIEKFNLNLMDCPTCEHQEYACTCDHGEEEDGHEGHDH
ncbi:MAG: hypothetical protein NWS80_00025 [Akkermansiaceae bacterium]|jgi:hypothetical protein|nr:hypothetical protein [Akkermansiaceae bacterium]MDP4720494.1 hypothetical protein [Akkermansiaceae bacterium]MDP4778701.1 hypothetical protein [Akkermansiaceae bacterium]MDP4882851.1 hypothetical protein [Opitutales bacterium]